jgi:Legume lectin domain
MARGRAWLFAMMLFPAVTRPAAIDYRDFASLASLSLAGSARQEGRVLRLTPSRHDAAGAAWFRDRQPVSGGFESVFQFRLTEQGGLGGGADGFAFVLQNSGPSALGADGSGGGFALRDSSTGIPQSVAVFFDTFKNQEIGDPSNNFVTICTAGTPEQMHWPPPRVAFTRKLAVKLKDGRIHTARIAYQPPVLTVYLDNARVLVSTVDLSTVTGPDGAAWTGFTASTGSGFENHDILSWSFSRPDSSSSMVSSIVSFPGGASFPRAECLPGRNLCTPQHAVIDETGSGVFHVVLPGNLEWGASIPNPMQHRVTIGDASGTVCHDVESLGAAGCSGPAALIQRTSEGRTWFSVNGAVTASEGYFEFEAQIQ